MSRREDESNRPGHQSHTHVHQQLTQALYWPGLCHDLDPANYRPEVCDQGLCLSLHDLEGKQQLLFQLSLLTALPNPTGSHNHTWLTQIYLLLNTLSELLLEHLPHAQCFPANIEAKTKLMI
jgi:hypothetical protein